MDRVIERTLREFGFGETRLKRFEETYSAYKEAENIGDEVEAIMENRLRLDITKLKIRNHARERYVERVLGLQFKEPHMSNYIRDNLQHIDSSLKELISESRFLLKKPDDKTTTNELMYFLNGDMVFVVSYHTDSDLYFLITVIRRVISGVPQEFAIPMLSAAADELEKMVSEAERDEDLIALELKIRSLREELKLLEEARKQRIREGSKTIQEIYNKAKFIFGKDVLEWQDTE